MRQTFNPIFYQYKFIYLEKMTKKIMLASEYDYFTPCCLKYQSKSKHNGGRMNKFIKRAAIFLGVISLALMLCVGYYGSVLPDSYYVSGDGGGKIACGLNISAEPADDAIATATGTQSEIVTLKLYGLIPIKNASVTKADAPVLIPGGTPLGIKLLTDGVMVVSTTEVDGGSNPAKEAGIREGDNIIMANDIKITSSQQLANLIMDCKSSRMKLTILRNGKRITTTLTPVFSREEGTYKAGLLIRDSSAGIGTLTFIDPETGCFGALGHPISDFDTAKTMPLGSGEIVDANITGYEKGFAGAPGELLGRFVSGLAAGEITKNCDCGIFGILNYSQGYGEAIPIAFKSEVKEGEALIYTTISGNRPQCYKIEIQRVSHSETLKTKNLVIKVTDPELLQATGGILQGMSGSPIIQDGKLVGAVTHVFVGDPTMGYGIFIENMLDEAG